MSEKSSFEELMSQVDGFIFHPLTLGFVGFGVFCALLVFALPKLAHNTDKPNPIDQLKTQFGMPSFPTPLFVVAILLWGVLLLTLFVGLLTLLTDIVWNTLPSNKPEAKADFRFLLTKTTALTAVLGALVALPFTVIRLKLTTEQNHHNADVLFNEKLNDANTDLYAMQQVTVPVKDKNGEETHKRETIWQDDIIRRNGAIERLRALAEEAANNGQLKNADTIHRILQVYFQEIPFPASSMQSKPANEEILLVENEQTSAHLRPDIKSAGQALARLKSPEFNSKIIRNAIGKPSMELEETLNRISDPFSGPEFVKLQETLNRISDPFAGTDIAKLQESLKRISDPFSGPEFAKLQETLNRIRDPFAGTDVAKLQESLKRISDPFSGPEFAKLQETLKHIGQQSSEPNEDDEDAK